jgi:hypothetical protein
MTQPQMGTVKMTQPQMGTVKMTQPQMGTVKMTVALCLSISPTLLDMRLNPGNLMERKSNI